MIQFTVPLIPTAKGRPRAGVIAGHARIYTPAKTEQYERDFIALAAPHAPTEPLTGPLAVSLVFSLPTPASKPSWWRSAAEAGRVFPTGRPDADNLAKAVLDALNRSGAWWRDDAQVVLLRAEKRYGTRPGTYVEIAELREATAATWRAEQQRATPYDPALVV